MYSKFTLEKNGIVVFDKNIDKSKKGIEFFLEMYKGIKIDDNNIVITGSKDVEYLPLNIPFDKVMF
ncbi:hypothetical protein FAZ19_05825 [Sphingobacterium alkalisoli]|uniref:Uncharacterized protein n=1 Tax=Sphingobacterium alkalisoli TaxID=1874115 RepID=A0A4V5LYG9_9SPHI|nr:hypothetical protein [Sphingobacterium alkalisoli]TJY66439.1 hypothetical protein FAZ19_05825 [Sphingobacterium alkalisoli]